MRDRWNLLFGLVSSAWSAILALASVPFYLRFLGIEAFGLIGFFVALQALFGVLDMGLSATISREVARSRATDQPGEARDLLSTLATIYWVTAVLIGASVALAAGPIANHWLRDTAMARDDIRQAVILMGVVIVFRWPVALYAGALIGAGKLTSVSVITIIISTVTNVGAVLVLWRIAPTIEAFFVWQAFCTLLHVAIIALVAWREMGGRSGVRFDLSGLKRIWRFSAGLSVAAIIGTVFMQTDKVILSRIVPLAALGTYVLAGTAARILYIILTPAFNVIYPRMTAMVAAGHEDELVRYYRNGTQLLIAIIMPFSTYVALFAQDLLLIWTHNPTTASAAAPLVPLLIAGTALNGIMHFPYALQLAAGRSKLPATINLILLSLFVPMLTVLASRYGVMGGAAAWAVLNTAYVFLGTWMTHRVILRGVGLPWITRDVTLPLVVSVAVTGFGAVVAHAIAVHFVVQLAIGACFALLATLICGLSCPPALAYLRAFIGKPSARPAPHLTRLR